MKKLFYILLLIPYLCTYAQTAPTDWTKMGLKGKVKSVETGFYFAVEKDGVISKGDPFSMGFYTPERIEKFYLMQKMGANAFFLTFLVDIVPSVVTYNQKGRLVEKRLFDTTLHRKIVYTYDAKNHLIDKSTFVRDLLAVKDTYKYKANGQKEEDLLNQLGGEGGVTCKYIYDADGRLIECNYIDVDGLPSAKETYTYKNKLLVGKDTYRNGVLSVRAFYEYDGENLLIGSLFKEEGSIIWDSKFTYDEHNKLKEEYIEINGNKNNGFRNKFSADGRVIEHLTLSSDKVSTFVYTNDKQGNWIKMINYENGVPMLYVERKIEYFK
nr:hypothetical protein [uncultured Capnocytophaga sp.]